MEVRGQRQCPIRNHQGDMLARHETIRWAIPGNGEVPGLDKTPHSHNHRRPADR